MMSKKISAIILVLLLAINVASATGADQPEEPTNAQSDTLAIELRDVDGSPLPSIASNMPIYPNEIIGSEANGVPRIEKVYVLDTKTDPARIPTANFVQEGYTYTLLDIIRNDYSEADTREHIEVFHLDSATKEMAEILQTLEPVLEYTGEDGYIGILALDHTSITVEAAGYKTSNYQVSATRTYPNLSDADLSLLPKTVTENGRELTLAHVDWQTAAGTQADGYELALRYDAIATYTATATSKSATGYIVTAEYHGEVTKTVQDKVVYTAIFSGSEIETAQSSSNIFNGVLLPVIILIVAFIAAVVVGVVLFRRRKAGTA